MVATKEQERKALERIRKIVAELGPDSYIATAFEGCFEIAEENIDNDFACSMKQRADKAREDAEHLKAEADRLSKENEVLRKRVLSIEDAGAIKAILNHAQIKAADTVNKAAHLIVENAENPNGTEFRQAVRDHRVGEKRLHDCQDLIRKLLATME